MSTSRTIFSSHVAAQLAIILSAGLFGSAAFAEDSVPFAPEQPKVTKSGVKFFFSGGASAMTDVATATSASTAVNAKLALQFLFPHNGYLGISVDANKLVNNKLQSNEKQAFGAEVLNPRLGGQSLALDFKITPLEELFGGFVYLKIANSTWIFAASDADAAALKGAPQAGAVALAAGFGPLVAYRPDPKNLAGNNLYLDVGFGPSIRVVGGNVAEGSRISPFLGVDGVGGVDVAKTAFGGIDFLRGSVEFNAVRFSANASYIFGADVDGLSGVRFLVDVGLLGDVVRVAP